MTTRWTDASGRNPRWRASPRTKRSVLAGSGGAGSNVGAGMVEQGPEELADGQVRCRFRVLPRRPGVFRRQQKGGGSVMTFADQLAAKQLVPAGVGGILKLPENRSAAGRRPATAPQGTQPATAGWEKRTKFTVGKVARPLRGRNEKSASGRASPGSTGERAAQAVWALLGRFLSRWLASASSTNCSRRGSQRKGRLKRVARSLRWQRMSACTASSTGQMAG